MRALHGVRAGMSFRQGAVGGNTSGEVAEPTDRVGAAYGEALVSKPPANPIDLLVWLDAGSLTDFRISQTGRFGPNQGQHMFAIRHGLNSTLHRCPEASALGARSGRAKTYHALGDGNRWQVPGKHATAPSPLSDALHLAIVALRSVAIQSLLLAAPYVERIDAVTWKAVIGLSWPLCNARAGGVRYCAAVHARRRLMDV